MYQFNEQSDIGRYWKSSTQYMMINDLTGFKLALLEFSLALEKEMIKDIMLFCEENSNLFDQKLSNL
jgi:hypothetical protein